MENKKILMVTSECVPFAKTGGLADVLGVLPKKINEFGNDCRVILPLYRQIKEKYIDELEFIRWTTIHMGWRTMYSGLFKKEHDGVIYYFIDNEFYFNTPSIYTDYSFDIERFSFFQRAVLDALGEPMDFYPDILHCHDWQTGMIPCLLDAHYKPNGYFLDIKTVYTIHNLQYQGVHGVSQIADFMDLPSSYLTEYGVLHNGVPNFMKAGIVYSDLITTVSPNYAKEIMTSFYGKGLNGVLKGFEYKVKGILNGIDMDSYNPETDPDIVKNYNLDTVYNDKVENKLAMQRELALEENKDIPLITMVTRLVDQKGLDLLIRVVDEMMKENCQMVVLGTGDGYYDHEMYLAEERNKKNFRGCVMYDSAMSRRLYAAGDIFLMPSIFEPCGLSQMIAMRYGNVPFVRDTGGLKDTVIAYNIETGEGNGFSFPNINAHDMLFLMKKALNLYQNDKNSWNNIIRNGMVGDYSWDKSAREYNQSYDELLAQ